MGDQDTGAIVASKLRSYGVYDENSERKVETPPADLGLPPFVKTRSVSFIDEETGEISRPGTGQERHRPDSRDSARGFASPRGGNSRYQESRPGSSGDKRPGSAAAEGVRTTNEQQRSFVVPRPPPKRPASSAFDRPGSSGSVCEAASITTKQMVVQAPDLQPSAGFGVDISVVYEVEDFHETESCTVSEFLPTGNANQVFPPVSTVIVGEESDAEEERSDSSPTMAVRTAEPAEIAERKILRILRFVPWFREFSMQELRDVARAGLALFYPQGCTIVSQGDDGDSMFVVIQGRVHVEAELKDGTVRAQKHQGYSLEEAKTFGESGVVWVEPEVAGDRDDDVLDQDKWWKPDAVSDGWVYTLREWTVVAEQDCIVLELPRRRLLALFASPAEPSLQRHLRVFYEQHRGATVIQRAYRSYTSGKDARKKLVDMLARAAADMAAELKSLTPHSQAYMAMMGSLSHAAVADLERVMTPPPLRRPRDYISRTQQELKQVEGGGGEGKGVGRRRASVTSRAPTATSSAQSHVSNGAAARRDSVEVSVEKGGGIGGGGRVVLRMAGVGSPVLEADEEGVLEAEEEADEEGRDHSARHTEHHSAQVSDGATRNLVPVGHGDEDGSRREVREGEGAGIGGGDVGGVDGKRVVKPSQGLLVLEASRNLISWFRRMSFKLRARRRRGTAQGHEADCEKERHVHPQWGQGTEHTQEDGGGRSASRGGGSSRSHARLPRDDTTNAREDTTNALEAGEGRGVMRTRSSGSEGAPKSALRPQTTATRPQTKKSAVTSATSEGGRVEDWRERNWTLLIVTVVQCQELARRAYRGALGAPVDATLEVSLDAVRYTIPAPILRTCAPYFNETFAFQLPEPEDNVPEPELYKIEIIDAGYRRKQGGFNKKRRRGDSLGFVLLPTAGRGDEGWHYLQNMQGEVTVGRVMVRSQRVILEGLKGPWYVCSARERFRLDMLHIKAERRRVRVGRLVGDMVQEEANKPKPPKPSNIMHPAGNRRTELDQVVFVASFVVLLLAPLSVCFEVQATWGEWLVIASSSCDGIFMADVSSRFFSGFFFLDAHGEWKVEGRASRCRAHYLDAWRLCEMIDQALAFLHAHGLLWWVPPNRKAPRIRPTLPNPPKCAGGGVGGGVTRPEAGCFWLDLLTCFPAELFLAMCRLSSDPFYRARQVVSIGAPRTFLRVLQAVKMARVWRLHGFLGQLQRSRSTRLRGGIVIKVLVYTTLWVHWVACLWFAALRSAASSAASSVPQPNQTNFTNSTKAAYTSPSALDADQAIQALASASSIHKTTCGENGCMPDDVWWTCDDREKLMGVHADAAARYVCALHWATQTMLGVGLGDVPLLSPPHRVLAIIAMPLGLAVAMSVAAAVAALLPGAPIVQTAFAARVRRVISFLKVRGLPKDLRKDVQRLYESEWQATGGNDDLVMLRELPLSLQARAITAVDGHLLNSLPFFRGRMDDLRFWRILLKGLEQVSYMEGEWLVREGETAQYMFLLKAGQCDVLSERFQGQGLDEDGRPLIKRPVLPEQPPAPEWELLDWEEEERRAKDEADAVTLHTLNLKSRHIPVFVAGETGGVQAKHLQPQAWPSPRDAAHDLGWPAPDPPGIEGVVAETPGREGVVVGQLKHPVAPLDVDDEIRPQDLNKNVSLFVQAPGADAVGDAALALGPDPRRHPGPRPWWSPMAFGRGSLSAWDKDKSVISIKSSSSDLDASGSRSFYSSWSPFGKGKTGSVRNVNSSARSFAAFGSSLPSMRSGGGSDTTAATWPLPRPQFLSKIRLGPLGQYLQMPDFGPPPHWLPDSLHPYWPTGRIRTAGGGGGGWGGANSSMSAVSKDDSASQYSSFLRSGAGSPSLVSRSVVSMSPSHAGMHAKSTNKSPRHQPKVVEEPPFVYGKLNAGAFFGDVAMDFGVEEEEDTQHPHHPQHARMSVSEAQLPRRLRPASVRATQYCRVLRIPCKTLQELAREFPHDIGMGMREAAATGRRNMARMRWRMVWAKHRLQILREAESIVNPQEPWPYTQIIVEAPEALGDIADAHGEMLRVEADGDAEVEHVHAEMLCVQDGLDGEDGAACSVHTDAATSLAPHHIASPHPREGAGASGAGASGAGASGAGASGAPQATAAIGSSKWRKGNAGKGKGTGGGMSGGGMSWSNPTGSGLSSSITDRRSREGGGGSCASASDRSRATTASTPPGSSSPEHQTAERQGEEEDGSRAVAAATVSTAVSTPTTVTSAWPQRPPGTPPPSSLLPPYMVISISLASNTVVTQQKSSSHTVVITLSLSPACLLPDPLSNPKILYMRGKVSWE